MVKSYRRHLKLLIGIIRDIHGVQIIGLFIGHISDFFSYLADEPLNYLKLIFQAVFVAAGFTAKAGKRL